MFFNFNKINIWDLLGIISSSIHVLDTETQNKKLNIFVNQCIFYYLLIINYYLFVLIANVFISYFVCFPMLFIYTGRSLSMSLRIRESEALPVDNVYMWE